MKKLLATIFIVLLGYWVTWLLSPSPVFAYGANSQSQTGSLSTLPVEESWVNPTPQDQGQRVVNCTDGDINADCMQAYSIRGLATALGAAGIGYPGLGANAPVGLRNGAAQFFAQGIDFMSSTRPASSIDYIAYMGSKLQVPGFPQTAYAAEGGYGFNANAITAVLRLWTISRNLAYLIFAIIFIVVGIMIMLRVKIDPKTAASIQTALPKIIIALILVTFSYAIAGFLIDIMYVLIGLVLGIADNIGVKGIGEIVRNRETVFHWLTKGEMWGVTSSTAAAVGNIVDSLISGKAQDAQGVAGSITGFLTSGIAFLIVAIAIIWALFKTWLALIGAYTNIVMAIIVAPLRLMLDAIPGQNQFGGWVRDILANLLCFPVVIILMVIGTAITTNLGQGIKPEDAGSGFVPPLIGGSSQAAVQALLGLGLLLLIPKVLDMMREILKAPAWKYGTAWSEAIGVGRNVTGAMAGGTYGNLVSPAQSEWETYSEGLRKNKLGLGPPPGAPSRAARILRYFPKAGK